MSQTATSVDANVEPTGAGTLLDFAVTEDLPMPEQILAALQSPVSPTQPVFLQQQTQLTRVSQVAQTVGLPVEQTAPMAKKKIWAMTNAPSQQTEPPLSMAGMTEDVTPSAISAEAYATPSTASAETGGTVCSLNRLETACPPGAPDAQNSNVQ